MDPVEADAMHTTPVSLLERLRGAADQAAWDRFVALYTPLLYHWARRFGLKDSDASDFVQDIFTILVRTLPTFVYEPAKRFRGWLWTITRNKWREWQRRLAGRPEPFQMESLVEVGELGDVEPGQGIDEVEYRKYVVDRAMQLMQAEFQPKTWKACWEYVVEGRAAADVAKELGMSVNAVHLAKARVLRRLREELSGLLD